MTDQLRLAAANTRAELVCRGKGPRKTVWRCRWAALGFGRSMISRKFGCSLVCDREVITAYPASQCGGAPASAGHLPGMHVLFKGSKALA
jgi:hypothetical protein